MEAPKATSAASQLNTNMNGIVAECVPAILMIMIVQIILAT